MWILLYKGRRAVYNKIVDVVVSVDVRNMLFWVTVDVNLNLWRIILFYYVFDLQVFVT